MNLDKRVLLFILSSILLFVQSSFSANSERISGRIAIFKERLPNVDTSIADKIQETLIKQGNQVDCVSSDILANPKKLNRNKYAMLIIPESQSFPAVANDNLLAFLKHGGFLFTLNGPPFENPCWQRGSQWFDKTELIAQRNQTEPKTILLNFELEKLGEVTKLWQRDVNDKTKITTLSIVPDGANRTKQSLMAHVSNLTAWDTYQQEIKNPFPARNRLTCFWAKGMTQTTALAIEWGEQDGSRWIASIKLTPKWKYYVLPPASFRYWHDSPTGGKRGFTGDLFHPNQAKYLRIGLAFSHTFLPVGEHAYWLDELGTAPDPAEQVDSFVPPVLDSISPSYKCYPITAISQMSTSPMLTSIGAGLGTPVELGFDKSNPNTFAFSPTRGRKRLESINIGNSGLFHS